MTLQKNKSNIIEQMNVKQLLDNQNINQVLKYHHNVSNMRNNAKTIQQKVNAMQKQIGLYNLMNNAGAYYSGSLPEFKLILPNDFIADFLDTQHIEDLWVATSINKGNPNKSTILGDVQNVFKLFNYLDLIEPNVADKIAIGDGRAANLGEAEQKNDNNNDDGGDGDDTDVRTEIKDGGDNNDG